MSNKGVRKLGGDRIMAHDFMMRRLAARAESGTKLSDVMHPEYFQNHISTLGWGAEIAVISEDLSLDCVVRIIGQTQTTTEARLLHVFAAPDMPEEAMKTATPARVVKSVAKEVKPVSEHKIEFAGPDKWRILHAGKVLVKGMNSEQQAKKRLEAILTK